MRQPAIRPTGVERSFRQDEIIVSKTDVKGVIRYANDVFLRVSAYDEREVVGKPHSILRHPEMPRAVFQLMWDTIQAGEEIFAYIVNLAGDGAHYWVLAHVTPSLDPAGRIVGYHSNRRVPDRSAVAEVQQVYAELLRAERGAGSGREATARSTAALEALLSERGQSYDEFVWRLTAAGAGAR